MKQAPSGAFVVVGKLSHFAFRQRVLVDAIDRFSILGCRPGDLHFPLPQSTDDLLNIERYVRNHKILPHREYYQVRFTDAGGQRKRSS